MNGTHLSDETHRKLENGELHGPELIEALRHVGSCELCAPRGEALAQWEEEALEALLAEPLEFESPAPRPRWTTYAMAAMLAAIVLLVTFLALRRRTPPATPPPAPPVVSTQEPPAPQRITPRPHDEWLHLVDAAVVAGKLPFPSTLAELAPSRDDLRGTQDPGDDHLQPSGVVIREQRPRLTWRTESGATYVVSIFADDAEQARSEELRVAEWRPTRALARGVTYVWQVEIRKDGATKRVPTPPAPPAMFRITTSGDERAIDEALQQWPDEHLLHAVLFARAGLRDDAIAALKRARANGDARAAKIQP